MPSIVSIVGKSGAGKTTLMEKLIPILKRRGHKVGVIKHSGHGFQMDTEGKDSSRHKAAGAQTVAVVSHNEMAILKEMPVEISISDMLPFFGDMDIIITEGFKRQPLPKIEIFRKHKHRTPLCINDETLMAYISDENLHCEVPVFDLEDIEGLADFIEENFLTIQYPLSSIHVQENVGK
jgi:molybdopterin-guanine dinucleotide biosynthesis protein B